MNRPLLVVAAAIVAAANGAAAQAPTAQGPRIVTTGQAQRMVTPDRATVFVGVQSRALTAAAAAADNARRQKAIIDTLKAMGIAADQIGTENYSVSPEMRYDPPGSTPRVTGYVVSNSVRVELKRIDQVGQAIDASLAKGANEISGVQFAASEAVDARRLAMADAVKSARADAEALAKAAGGSLGALIELSSSAPEYRPVMGAVAMTSAVVRAPTPIEPGQQTVSATVSAIWQFVPGGIR